MMQSNDSSASPSGSDPSLREYLAILYGRRFVILGVALTTTIVVALGAYLSPAVFTADTALLVRFGRHFIYRPEVPGIDSSRTFSLEEMVNSEVEILRSRQLAREVVDELGVENLYPDLSYSDAGREAVTAIATVRLQEHVDVSPVLESSIIRVTLQHSDAELAADALNLLVEKYKDLHLKIHGDSSAEFLRSQLDRTRKTLADAESALRSFKGDHKIYEITEQERSLISHRSQLQTEIRTTRFRLTEIRHNREAIQNGLIGSLSASSRPMYTRQREALMSRRNELSAVLEESEYRFSELRQQLTFAQKARKRSAPPLTTEEGVGRSPEIAEALVRLLDLEIREKDLLRTHREESRELSAIRDEIVLVRKFLKTRGKQIRRAREGSMISELVSLRARRKTLNQQVAQIDEDLSRLSEEDRSLHDQSLKAEQEALQMNETTLVSELSQTDEQLARLSAGEGMLRQLEREVTVAEERFRINLAKFEEAKVAGELDEQKVVNIRVIEKASRPISPSGLSHALKIAVGAVVGLVAGLALACFLELFSSH